MLAERVLPRDAGREQLADLAPTASALLHELRAERLGFGAAEAPLREPQHTPGELGAAPQPQRERHRQGWRDIFPLLRRDVRGGDNGEVWVHEPEEEHPALGHARARVVEALYLVQEGVLEDEHAALRCGNRIQVHEVPNGVGLVLLQPHVLPVLQVLLVRRVIAQPVPRHGVSAWDLVRGILFVDLGLAVPKVHLARLLRVRRVGRVIRCLGHPRPPLVPAILTELLRDALDPVPRDVAVAEAAEADAVSPDCAPLVVVVDGGRHDALVLHALHVPAALVGPALAEDVVGGLDDHLEPAAAEADAGRRVGARDHVLEQRQHV
mmetsp:Transcript_135695/g.377978  ORF Transcript_135695/g.377978 Transcript_135695/m.377978 type:complete len:323 (+) Transcript_135695:221-1189(+)